MQFAQRDLSVRSQLVLRAGSSSSSRDHPSSEHKRAIVVSSLKCVHTAMNAGRALSRCLATAANRKTVNSSSSSSAFTPCLKLSISGKSTREGSPILRHMGSTITLGERFSAIARGRRRRPFSARPGSSLRVNGSSELSDLVHVDLERISSLRKGAPQ